MNPNSPSENDRVLMLDTALTAIEQGLETGNRQYMAPPDLDAALSAPGASFVTLTTSSGLRGCIGSLEAHTGLLEGVADHAFAAAFRDPRFPPLGADELAGLTLEISLLSPLSEVEFANEEELLEQMVPGEAGWVLEEGLHRGTFLPSVWSSLENPLDFLQQLKRKAGLAPDYWSGSIRAWRYTTTSFSSPVREIRRRVTG